MEDVLAIHQDIHITERAGPDLWLDSKFLFCCLLQAHGRLAKVASKQSAPDNDVHSFHPEVQIVLQYIIEADGPALTMSRFALNAGSLPAANHI